MGVLELGALNASYREILNELEMMLGMMLEMCPAVWPDDLPVLNGLHGAVS